MIETKDGILRVSASYSMKVPGSIPYSSEDAHYSISFEQPVEDGVSLDALVEQAQDISAVLTQGVKLQVFSSLDVAFEDADGELRPVLTVTTVPTAAPKAGGVPKSGNTAPSVPAPKAATTSARATIVADFGLGSNEYLDNRELKASSEFKPGAADFRSVEKIREGGYHSVWVAQKGGAQNADVVAALTAAGIAV